MRERFGEAGALRDIGKVPEGREELSASQQRDLEKTSCMDVIKQYPGPLTVSRAVNVETSRASTSRSLRQIVKVHNN